MAKKIIRIAVADDQAMFRTGLVSLLQETKNFQVVAEAGDGKEIIEKLEEIEADIVFLDFRMPHLNGIEAAKIIRQKFPDIGILILSMYDDQEFVISALENGANGYLTKDDSPAEIKNSVESVLSTGYFINDRTSKILVKNLVQTGKVNPVFKEMQSAIRFSEDEIKVIKLIAQEYSNKQIGELMARSESTIEKYKASIMSKTGTKNAAGIVMYGVRHRIVIVD